MDCRAVTLYEKKGEQMICIEYDGLTTPENFSLDDPSSYVSQTYNDSNHDEKLYYSLEKRTCYFLFKAKNYVFCFHLPLLGEWDQYKRMSKMFVGGSKVLVYMVQGEVPLIKEGG